MSLRRLVLTERVGKPRGELTKGGGDDKHHKDTIARRHASCRLTGNRGLTWRPTRIPID